MINSDVIGRVFSFRTPAGEGTIFTMDHAGRQYLVSAKHLLAEVEQSSVLEILHDGVWKPLPVRLVGHASGDVDISVVAAQQALTGPDYIAPPTADGLLYGQTVYFLGFPFGFHGDFPDLQQGFPMPFVKSATLSMMGPKDRPMYLDGINNEGFSGGPVVWRPAQAKISEPLQIAGVVAGFEGAEEVVTHNGEDVGHRYVANTGLIRAFPIRHAVSLAEANPIGYLHPPS